MAYAPRNPELLHWWRCMQLGGATETRPLGERRELMSPEARERSFDDLARGLASGSISRGKALRLMGAALVGGGLASIPRVAAAATCANPSACCTCHLEDASGEVRRRCFLLSTTGCSSDASKLVNQCNRRCKKFQERKYPNLSVGNAQVGCNDSNAVVQSICQKSTTPGVRGTECGLQSCTPPA